MSRKLDQILVIDVEATCWPGDPPPGQVSEIIEIGLCMLDVATGQRGEKVSLLVRPRLSTVSPHCTALTTLTQDEVDAGLSLAEACHELETRYGSRDRIWASYGDYDRIQFRRNCDEARVDYPFGRTHLNVKTLLALAWGLDKEVRLDRAMAMRDWPLEGTHHRGADDAWNIARLLGDLLLRARQGRETDR